MNDPQSSLSTAGYLWRIPVIGVAFSIGLVIAGALVTMLGMEFPNLPGQTHYPIADLLASLLLAVCIVPLTRGVAGSGGHRWIILGTFVYVSYGLNNQIESAVFTTAGAFNTMVLFFIIPCALIAAAAVSLIKNPEDSTISTVFSDRPASRWWWRAVLAWLSFPVVYLFFGMVIYPMVRDVYEAPDSGLVLPDGGVVLRTVLLRSLLFLLVTIPILRSWTRSRRSLALALGIAFTGMVGLVGLVQAHWWPVAMRVVHSVEICADSFVYAWLLVVLFVPRSNREHRAPSPEPPVAVE
jgi:hypothetical protein